MKDTSTCCSPFPRATAPAVRLRPARRLRAAGRSRSRPLAQLATQATAGRIRGTDKIGLCAGRVVNKHEMARSEGLSVQAAVMIIMKAAPFECSSAKRGVAVCHNVALW